MNWFKLIVRRAFLLARRATRTDSIVGATREDVRVANSDAIRDASPDPAEGTEPWRDQAEFPDRNHDCWGAGAQPPTVRTSPSASTDRQEVEDPPGDSADRSASPDHGFPPAIVLLDRIASADRDGHPICLIDAMKTGAACSVNFTQLVRLMQRDLVFATHRPQSNIPILRLSHGGRAVLDLWEGCGRLCESLRDDEV